MLGDVSGLEKIYIVCGYTDMRKSIDGLQHRYRDQLKMDPSSSALFLFCGRRRDGIKALFQRTGRLRSDLQTVVCPRRLSMAQEAVGGRNLSLAGVLTG